MALTGIRQYSTGNPGALATELARENALVEEEFRRMELELAPRWNPVSVARDGRLRHGDAAFVDTTSGARVLLLPPSTQRTKGLCIRVVRFAGTADIVLAAQAHQAVQGGASDTLDSSVERREYMDSGLGSWWRT